MDKKIAIIIVIVLGLFSAIAYFLLTPQTREEKVYKVGIVSAMVFFDELIDAFKEEMTNFGYIEGKNIVYEIYRAPTPVGNEEAIQKIVDKKVDLILSIATEISIETKKVIEGTGISQVFANAFVEGTGLIESVSAPGGNTTGVRYPTIESASGRLEFLLEIAPQVKRVWVPYLKDYPTTKPQIEALKSIASTRNITLIEGAFSSSEEVKTYLDERAKSNDIGFDAIVMLAEPFSIDPKVTDAVYKFADEHMIPISSYGVLEEDFGPVIGFHPQITKQGRLAANLADKILKGMPAGTIPVVTAENDLTLNLRVARKLGLNVSESLVNIAIKVVR